MSQIAIAIARVATDIFTEPCRRYKAVGLFCIRKLNLDKHQSLVDTIKDIQFSHQPVFQWNTIARLAHHNPLAFLPKPAIAFGRECELLLAVMNG